MIDAFPLARCLVPLRARAHDTALWWLFAFRLAGRYEAYVDFARSILCNETQVGPLGSVIAGWVLCQWGAVVRGGHLILVTGCLINLDLGRFFIAALLRPLCTSS